MLAAYFPGRLAADTRGNVLLTFGLALPVLLGTAGLAVDSARFYNQQSRMQSAADSTALAVAKELHLYRKNLGELRALGEVRAEALLGEVGIAGNPHDVDITVDADTNLIRVDIRMVAPSFLPADIWGENPIAVMAEAHAYGQSRLCVLALHATASETIKADGSASLAAPDCAVQSNSRDPTGLNVGTGSTIVSTVICSTGGVKGSTDSFTPAPQTDCPPLEDPLSSRAPPAVGGCDYLDRKIEAGKVSIAPGHYCGGLKIDKTAEVTAEPGIYVFSGGKLEVKGTAKLIGDYVGFYFQDDAALFEFDSDASVDLGAPKDGPMAGILFYENPAATAGRTFVIKSRDARRLLGTIYLPRGKLKVDADASVAAQSAYTVIVARQLDVKSADLVINSDYGGTDVPVPDGVGPNSSMVMLDR